MTETGTPRQDEEDLVLMVHAEVAKMMRFSPDGFTNWLAEGSEAAKAFKRVPFITRSGRTKLWRKSDIRRFVAGQLKVA